MEYSFNQLTGPTVGHLCHRIELYDGGAKGRAALLEHLADQYGQQHQDWRFTRRHSINSRSTVQFLNKTDAFRFKLTWDEAAASDSMEDWMVWYKQFTKSMVQGNWGGGIGGHFTSYRPAVNWAISPHVNIEPMVLKARTFNPCREVILDEISSTAPFPSLTKISADANLDKRSEER